MAVKAPFAFDADVPDAVRAAEEMAAELVREVDRSTKAGLRRLVVLAMRDKVAPQDLADMIQPMIGLTRSQVEAVWRLRGELLEQGLSAEKVEDKIERVAKKKLRARAFLIARTETMRALNAGLNESFQQAKAKGFVGADMLKEFIVTNDERLDALCEHHAGEKVPIGESFSDGDPPLHPACRCTMGLVRGRIDRRPPFNP